MNRYKIIIILNLIHCICYAGPQEDTALIMATAAGNIDAVNTLLGSFVNGSPNSATIERCIGIAKTNERHNQMFRIPFDHTNNSILNLLRNAFHYYKELEDQTKAKEIMMDKENRRDYEDTIFRNEDLSDDTDEEDF